MRVSRLGVKSLDSHYVMEDAGSGQVLAEASAVLVAYDYREGRSIPIPEEWRRTITAYEQL